MTQFEEPDEYCPHCDNHFVIEAVTPETLREEKAAAAKKKRLQREAADQKKLQLENEKRRQSLVVDVGK